MRNPSASSSWLTAICALLLATGLFCVQICQVVCATVACTNEDAAVPAPTANEHAHCHPQSQPEPQKPQPRNHSHDCQKHAVLQSLLPDNQTAKQQAQLDWQLAFSVPLSWTEIDQFEVALKTPAPIPFKPPPRQQHSTVQRI